MIKCIGPNIYTTGHRIYYRTRTGGRRLTSAHFELIAWTQERCIVCARFLNKYNSGIRCPDCAEVHKKDLKRIWNQNHN